MRGQHACRVSSAAHTRSPLPRQVCCLPRSPWSTSSRGPPPRVWVAAPAAAAALTARQVLPRPGAPPAPSPPPAGPSEGQDPAPRTPLSCREQRRLMHRIYLISRSPCQTPFGQMLRVWTCPSVQAPFRSCCTLGTGRAAGAGQGSVVQSGIVLENRAGSAGVQLPPGFPGHLPSRAQCIDNL